MVNEQKQSEKYIFLKTKHSAQAVVRHFTYIMKLLFHNNKGYRVIIAACKHR